MFEDLQAKYQIKGTKYNSVTHAYVGRNLTVTTALQFEAISYNWWYLLKLVNGKYTLNTYKFSKTTTRQINALKSWLQLREVPFVEVNTRDGLNGEGKEYFKIVGGSSIGYEVDRFDTQEEADKMLIEYKMAFGASGYDLRIKHIKPLEDVFTA